MRVVAALALLSSCARTTAQALIGTSFDLTGPKADWDAVMTLDPSTGAASKLANYSLADQAAAAGFDEDVLWLVTSDGLLQSYNATTGAVNFTISVELDLALCDPPYQPCVMNLHWSAERRAFVGMALGYVRDLRASDLTH
jgi:hypothetical protein